MTRDWFQPLIKALLKPALGVAGVDFPKRAAFVQNWNFGKAAAALDRLPLNEANRAVATVWLNSWRGGSAPRLTIFLDNCVQKPAIAVFRIRQRTSLHCVYAGAYFKHVLGFDIANRDILDLVKQDDADGRLARSWEIVEGAALISDHVFESLGGASVKAQSICLPLMDKQPDGSRHFLLHTSWRPTKNDMMINSVRGDLKHESSRVIEHFDLATAPQAAT